MAAPSICNAPWSFDGGRPLLSVLSHTGDRSNEIWRYFEAFQPQKAKESRKLDLWQEEKAEQWERWQEEKAEQSRKLARWQEQSEHVEAALYAFYNSAVVALDYKEISHPGSVKKEVADASLVPAGAVPMYITLESLPTANVESPSSCQQLPDATVKVPLLPRDLLKTPTRSRVVPWTLPEGDRRFAQMVADRKYCCDCCFAVCSYRSLGSDSDLHFDGGYVHSHPSNDVNVLHQSWLNGQWDASWNCSYCKILLSNLTVSLASYNKIRNDLYAKQSKGGTMFPPDGY